MSDTFKIPASVMPKALEAFKKGAKDFDNFAQAASALLDGCTPVKFKAAFESVRAEAARADALAKVEKAAADYNIPAGLIKVLKKGAKFITENTIEEKKKGDKVIQEGYTPKLTFVVELDGDKGVLKVISGKKSKRSANGTVGSNSRISAFNAYKRGKKAGDTFKVEKADEGGKKGFRVDGRFVPSRGKGGGLAGFILKTQGDSKTAEILRNYGYSLD